MPTEIGRQDTLKGRPTGHALPLRVGVANAVPKLMVFRMLRPVMESDRAILLSCHEGQPEQLLAQLATTTPTLARRLRRGFPNSLQDLPMLLPTPLTALRRSLEQWFDDPALMKAFGEAGTAVFPAPTAIAAEVCGHYGVAIVGTTDAVRERYCHLPSSDESHIPAFWRHLRPPSQNSSSPLDARTTKRETCFG